jgi:uncharacterized repeat protein (TIGR01451 family)
MKSTEKENQMEPKLSQHSTVSRSIFAALAITALAAIGSPGTASAANTTANAKLLNVATVQYKDASGLNPWTATASATVTVNLVKAALTPSAAPNGDGPWSLVCQSPGTYASGTTVSSLYALHANANGTDSYGLSILDSAPVNVNNYAGNTHYKVLNSTGAVVSTDALNVTLGSAIPVGVSGNDTLLFPGGSLTGSGFAANDLVVVQFGATSRVYQIVSVTVNRAATEGHGDGLPHTDVGSTQTEIQDQIKLQAYATQTILGSTVVGSGAPAFGTTAPTLGVPVGEMALIEIDVAASNNVLGLSGSLNYTLTSTNAGGNSTAPACTVSNWTSPNLNIKKLVRNVTNGETFALGLGSSTGKPGDILEYQLTIANTGSGNANAVTVTDPVPVYTHLIAGAAYGTDTGGLVTTDIFAQADVNGGTATNLTLQNSDNESATIASGNVVTGLNGVTGAGSTLTFYVGNANTSSLGGVVDSTHAYHIIYKVKID